jgi:hypothetical protein
MLSGIYRREKAPEGGEAQVAKLTPPWWKSGRKLPDAFRGQAPRRLVGCLTKQHVTVHSPGLLGVETPGTARVMFLDVRLRVELLSACFNDVIHLQSLEYTSLASHLSATAHPGPLLQSMPSSPGSVQLQRLPRLAPSDVLLALLQPSFFFRVHPACLHLPFSVISV